MVIKGIAQVDSIIRGFSILETGHDNAKVRASIDNGAIVYQGTAKEVVRRVTSAGLKTIVGRTIDMSLAKD